MTAITIIGVLHKDRYNPNVSSEAVCEILEKINPDVLLVECAIDEYERWESNIINPPTDESLEGNVFKRFLSKKKIPLLPFDMAGRTEIYNKTTNAELEETYKLLENIRDMHEYKNNNYIKDYFDFCDAEDEYIQMVSLKLLNSISEKVKREWWDDLCDKQIEPIISKVYPEKKEYLSKYSIYAERREREMAENLVSQTRKYSKAVALVGAGHKPGIYKHLENVKGEFYIKEYWHY